LVQIFGAQEKSLHLIGPKIWSSGEKLAGVFEKQHQLERFRITKTFLCTSMKKVTDFALIFSSSNPVD
jgi:hypothetical protein